MISKLSTEQFNQHLKSNVLKGSPWIKGSPFTVFTLLDNKTKYFYGEHSNSNFVLTRNAGMFNMTEFVIKGTYEPTSDQTGTQVKYEVKPIPFGYYWIRLIPPLFLTAISAILLFNFRTELLIPLTIMWVWLGIPWLIILWRSKKLKKSLERNFREFLLINDH